MQKQCSEIGVLNFLQAPTKQCLIYFAFRNPDSLVPLYIRHPYTILTLSMIVVLFVTVVACHQRMLTSPHGRTSDFTALYFVKLNDASLGFVTHTLMLGSAFIFGRRRVAVARYQSLVIVYVLDSVATSISNRVIFPDMGF